MEELKLKIYKEYTAFFDGFVALQINSPAQRQTDKGNLCHIFSSCCQVIVLLAKLLARSQVDIRGSEGEL